MKMTEGKKCSNYRQYIKDLVHVNQKITFSIWNKEKKYLNLKKRNKYI